MTNDIFIEQLVRRPVLLRDWLLRAAFCLLGTAFLAFGVYPISAMFPQSMLLLLLAAAVFVIWLGRKVFETGSIEYEYALTNGELDIDIIYGRRKRKHLLTIDVKKFEFLKPSADVQTFPRNDVIVDASSRNKSIQYCAYFKGKSGKQAVLLFDPNEKFVDAVKLYIPKKVTTITHD